MYVQTIRSLFLLHVLFLPPAVICLKNNGNISPVTLDSMKGRVIGGESVPIDKFPFLVQFFNLGALCAGSILNSWTVVTAAHCFDVGCDKYNMVIQVGAQHTYDSNADVYNVWYFKIHEDYNKSMLFACDIALLFVDTPIKFGALSQKAILVNNGEWMNCNEKNFSVSGWGWTKYPGGPISKFGLMTTQLDFIPTQQCNKLHNLTLTPDMFCLYGGGIRDTCKGDSGGGVVWNDMLVGIVSHGDGCAKKDKPSVYTNVWYFRNWIEKNVYKFIAKHCTIKKNKN